MRAARRARLTLLMVFELRVDFYSAPHGPTRNSGTTAGESRKFGRAGSINQAASECELGPPETRRR